MMAQESAMLFEAFHKANDTIKYFHYQWIDYSGFLCERVLPRDTCLAQATESSPVKVASLCLIGLCDMHASTTFRPGDAAYLYPDWRSLRRMSEHHASVLCSVAEGYDCNSRPSTAEPFLRCPRSVLERVLAYALANHGINFDAGFEIEFYLLDASECLAFPQSTRSSLVYLNGAVSLRGPHGKCVEACVDALGAAGIAVQQFHAESGPYQFEIVTGPLAAMLAVDTLVQSLEIIRSTAQQSGLRACFLPKPFAESDPSGLHMNLSLHTADTDAAESSQDAAFIAGILKHLPGLCAIGMPLESSYKRLGDMITGEWVAWGTASRDVPVRKSHDHWEFRTIDATANPYLTMAAYIAAGLSGIETQQRLAISDCRMFMSLLAPEEIKANGVHDSLPHDLPWAIWRLKNLIEDEDDFCRIAGKEWLDLSQIVQASQNETLQAMSDQDVGKLLLEFF
ncbi:hypothetical protein Q7P35_007515 [Cladosporium inversicolor]